MISFLRDKQIFFCKLSVQYSVKALICGEKIIFGLKSTPIVSFHIFIRLFLSLHILYSFVVIKSIRIPKFLVTQIISNLEITISTI